MSVWCPSLEVEIGCSSCGSFFVVAFVLLESAVEAECVTVVAAGSVLVCSSAVVSVCGGLLLSDIAVESAGEVVCCICPN